MDTYEWDRMPRNSKWYAEFQRRAEAFFKAEGLENCGPTLVPGQEDTGEWMPSFFGIGCSCCGTYMGGNRHLCDGWNPKERRIQDGYELCDDCIYYAEMGRLDDMTMIDMERLDKEEGNE